MQVYIHAKSKAEINRRLAAGENVPATDYSFTATKCHYRFSELPLGTVVKVYAKMIGATPYAIAYGTVKADKNGVRKVA